MVLPPFGEPELRGPWVQANLPDLKTDQEIEGFGMGATHFKMRTLEKVSTEMSLHALAYNLKRVIALLGVQPLIAAMQA